MNKFKYYILFIVLLRYKIVFLVIVSILFFIPNSSIFSLNESNLFPLEKNGSATLEKSTHNLAISDSSDDIYVADTDKDLNQNRIQKFDSNGTFITQWGGHFKWAQGPVGISIDSNGHVYVADTDNDRIQKFDSNGTFITKWERGPDFKFSAPLGIAIS